MRWIKHCRERSASRKLAQREICFVHLGVGIRQVTDPPRYSDCGWLDLHSISTKHHELCVETWISFYWAWGQNWLNLIWDLVWDRSYFKASALWLTMTIMAAVPACFHHNWIILREILLLLLHFFHLLVLILFPDVDPDIVPASRYMTS